MASSYAGGASSSSSPLSPSSPSSPAPKRLRVGGALASGVADFSSSAVVAAGVVAVVADTATGCGYMAGSAAVLFIGGIMAVGCVGWAVVGPPIPVVSPFAMGDDVAVDTPEAGGRCDATAVLVLDGKFWELGWNALRCMP